MRITTAAIWLLFLWVGSAAAQDQSVGPCAAQQIRATSRTGSAAGSQYIEVTLINVSPQTCVLSGPPRIAATGSADNVAAVQVRWPAEGPDIEKGLELIALNPKGQAQFVIRTADNGGSPGTTPCAGLLRVYLPGNAESRPIATIAFESCREIEVSGYRFCN